jgi:hypothetical protein
MVAGGRIFLRKGLSDKASFVVPATTPRDTWVAETREAQPMVKSIARVVGKGLLSAASILVLIMMIPRSPDLALVAELQQAWQFSNWRSGPQNPFRDYAQVSLKYPYLSLSKGRDTTRLNLRPFELTEKGRAALTGLTPAVAERVKGLTLIDYDTEISYRAVYLFGPGKLFLVVDWYHPCEITDLTAAPPDQAVFEFALATKTETP